MIDDIASIEDGFEKPDIISRFDGKTGISLSIKKKENSDVIRTVDALKKVLSELEENIPPEISIVQIEGSVIIYLIKPYTVRLSCDNSQLFEHN